MNKYSISDNKSDSVFHVGYEKALNNSVENFANVAINFDLIDKSAKFIAFFITSPEIPKVHLRHHGDFINKTTWDQEAICRVLDIKYRKELMSLSLPEKQCPVAVLAVLIVRGEKDGEWEVWPCAKYCKPSMPYTSHVVSEKDYQMFLCKFITQGEINKLFNI